MTFHLASEVADVLGPALATGVAEEVPMVKVA
jgi:hypothetical protein